MAGVQPLRVPVKVSVRPANEGAFACGCMVWLVVLLTIGVLAAAFLRLIGVFH
jgi:hypothetical protein